MNTDRITGSIKEAGGKAQAAVGKVLGDESTELEGRYRQAEGVAQDVLGQAKQIVRGAADEAEDFAQDTYRRGDRAVRGAARLVEKQVDETPVAALAAVAVIGFALGYAVRAASAE